MSGEQTTNKAKLIELFRLIDGQLIRIIKETRLMAGLQQNYREHPGPGQKFLPIEKAIRALDDIKNKLEQV